MRSARAFAIERSSSVICVASSRVGARMSADGRRSVASTRSTMGTPKASVLPDPVGDRARTSRPASTSATTSCWMAKGVSMPRAASALTTARDTPRSAKDCVFKTVRLLAADGPRGGSGGYG
jgi:hypothetical protein